MRPDSRLDEFRSTGSACPFDTNTHGLTVTLMQEFSRPRKYASTKKGLLEGEKVHKYLFIRHHGGKCTVTFNEKAIAAKKKYHGYFALVSNSEKDPFDCLYKYRRRETIEFFFESGKQRTDGNRTRVWSSECLMGRMLQGFTDGMINCVIVKDLSLFGRDHIDVGFYLEKYFPVKGVSDLFKLLKKILESILFLRQVCYTSTLLH